MNHSLMFSTHVSLQMRRSKLFMKYQEQKKAHYVQQRLKRIVRYAKQKSHYYRELYAGLDVGGDIEFSQIPFIDKGAFVRSFDALVTKKTIKWSDLDVYFRGAFSFQRRFAKKYLAFHTSGSTGRPAYIVWGEREIAISTAAYYTHISTALEKDLSIPGKRRKPKVAYIGIMDDYIGGNSWAYAMGGLTNLTMLNAFEPLDRLCVLLNRIQPDIVMTKPSLLGELARLQGKKQLHIAPRKIIFAGENISPVDKEDITTFFSIKPSNSYSMCETGPIAFQKDERQEALSVFEDIVYVELVDDHGSPIRDYYQNGNVVVTNLYNTLMPVIRYKTGDQACFIPTEKNGRFSTLSYIYGRSTAYFIFRNETGQFIKIPEYPFWNLYAPGVLRYQVIQKSLRSLKIKLQWKPGFNGDDERREACCTLRERVRDIINRRLDPQEITVEIEDVAAIKPNRTGKIQITFPIRQEDYRECRDEPQQ